MPCWHWAWFNNSTVSRLLHPQRHHHDAAIIVNLLAIDQAVPDRAAVHELVAQDVEVTRDCAEQTRHILFCQQAYGCFEGLSKQVFHSAGQKMSASH